MHSLLNCFLPTPLHIDCYFVILRIFQKLEMLSTETKVLRRCQSEMPSVRYGLILDWWSVSSCPLISNYLKSSVCCAFLWWFYLTSCHCASFQSFWILDFIPHWYQRIFLLMFPHFFKINSASSSIDASEQILLTERVRALRNTGCKMLIRPLLLELFPMGRFCYAGNLNC